MTDELPVLVTAGVIIRHGCVLAARRKSGSHLAGLWEFPGGKLEPGESPQESLARELNEELGVQARVGPIMEVVFHPYPDRNVLLLFYSCEIAEGEPRPLDVEELAWVPMEELLELDWAPADIPFVRKLKTSLVIDHNPGDPGADAG